MIVSFKASGLAKVYCIFDKATHFQALGREAGGGGSG